MDPLSIATGVVALATLATHMTKRIRRYTEYTQNVDRRMTDLYNEVNSVSTNVETLQSTWQENIAIIETRLAENQGLLAAIHTSIEDCDEILLRLQTALGKVDRDDIGNIGILRRPTRAYRLNQSMKEFSSYRHELASINAAMLTWLQMTNICLLNQQTLSQEKAHGVLIALGMQISRIEVAIGTAEHPKSGQPSLSGHKRISQHLQLFVEEARKFQSAAASSMSVGHGSIMSSDSYIGDHLTESQSAQILNWIAEKDGHEIPRVNSPDFSTSTMSSPHVSPLSSAAADYQRPASECSPAASWIPVESLSRSKSVSQTPTTVSKKSTVDTELETQVVWIMRDEIWKSRQEGNFVRAVTLLTKLVERGKILGWSHAQIEQEHFWLAIVHGAMGNFDGAETIIRPMTTGKGRKTKPALDCLQLMAAISVTRNDDDAAIEYAHRARSGYGETCGTSSLEYQQAVKFLAMIYLATGDTIEAELYSRTLPEEGPLEPIEDREIFAITQFDERARSNRQDSELRRSSTAVTEDDSSTQSQSPSDRSEAYAQAFNLRRTCSTYQRRQWSMPVFNNSRISLAAQNPSRHLDRTHSEPILEEASDEGDAPLHAHPAYTQRNPRSFLPERVSNERTSIPSFQHRATIPIVHMNRRQNNDTRQNSIPNVPRLPLRQGEARLDTSTLPATPLPLAKSMSRNRYTQSRPPPIDIAAELPGDCPPLSGGGDPSASTTTPSTGTSSTFGGPRTPSFGTQDASPLASKRPHESSLDSIQLHPCLDGPFDDYKIEDEVRNEVSTFRGYSYF